MQVPIELYLRDFYIFGPFQALGVSMGEIPRYTKNIVIYRMSKENNGRPWDMGVVTESHEAGVENKICGKGGILSAMDATANHFLAHMDVHKSGTLNHPCPLQK